jgi:hypothetical protein
MDNDLRAYLEHLLTLLDESAQPLDIVKLYRAAGAYQCHTEEQREVIIDALLAKHDRFVLIGELMRRAIEQILESEPASAGLRAARNEDLRRRLDLSSPVLEAMPGSRSND